MSYTIEELDDSGGPNFESPFVRLQHSSKKYDRHFISECHHGMSLPV